MTNHIYTSNASPNPFPPLAVLLGTLSSILLSGCGAAGARVPRYETLPIARGVLLQHITASGSLSAVVSVDVGSQVSGQISALRVDFNSPVKKGDLVAEIDPTVYTALLRQAQGDLAGARADATLKHQNLERKKVLVPLRAASQLDLDQATAEFAKAEATVVIKEAVVQTAQANLGYCKITAPVDGLVISRKVDLGQTVIAAMSTPVLFTIVKDISKMNITADVSESDIGQVRAEQLVDFTVDAFPNDVFHGRVKQVRKAPTTIQNVVTYQTIIAVENPDRKLFPGMTAEVSILVAERNDVLMAPNIALRFTPPDRATFEQSPPRTLYRGQDLVYALTSDGAKLRPIVVTTGVTDGVNTEIISGAQEGTALVASVLSGATNNAPFSGGVPPSP